MSSEETNNRRLLRETLAYPDGKPRWSSAPDLIKFALAGHGWGDSNGGFGVLYPGDEAHLAPGTVEIYGFWGPPNGFEVIVPERMYLEELVSVLQANGFGAESLQALVSRIERCA